MNERAGKFKTNLSGKLAYKSFVPSPLPPIPEIQMTKDIIDILVKANSRIMTLEEISKRVPNIELFVAMYVRKEALLSSQIEGTQASLEDVLDPMIEENRNSDVDDVINYIKATKFAINRMKELPICNRLLKETHTVLMEGVRGKEKNPGEFRKTQNWIGGQGSTLKNAVYIPPAIEDMKKALSDLEIFINTEDDMNILIKAGLIHYQFETIHPFLDGNGRVGRLLITLFLLKEKIITQATLYISYFLKMNRLEYYDRMTEVRNSGNYEQWIKFFLQAVYESADDAISNIDKLVALHDKNLEKIKTLGRSAKTATILFSYLEKKPIIDIQKTSITLDTAFNTTSKAIDNLISLDILKPVNGKNRNRTFVYAEYLDILRRGM